MSRIEFGNMIPDGIGDVFPNLQYIRIDAADGVLNSIERRHFKNMKKLQELNFYFVKIKIIAEDAFQDLPSLEKLNLQDCNIDYFPEKLFWNLNKLKLLSLGGNPSTFISPNAFQDVSSLTWLRLTNRIPTKATRFSPIGQICIVFLSTKKELKSSGETFLQHCQC